MFKHILNYPVRHAGLILILMMALFLNTTSALASDACSNEVRIPAAVEAGLTRLFTMLAPEAQGTFDSKAATQVVDFVLENRATEKIPYTKGALSDPSAYYPFDIQLTLDRFLQIAYNPDIPSTMIMPDSVRLARWNPESPPLPKFWKHLDTLTAPVIARGSEHIVNTPDPKSGAYFAYDLNRVMVLFKHQDKRILFSMSRQAKRSDVGKKGTAVGESERWDYLYTGKKGLTLAGLGWVSSYMYDSYSLSAYIESETGKPLVHAGLFKWIRAGWSSINMVKRKHIHAGLGRHVRTFKSIVENPSLPPVTELVAANERIRKLNRNQLCTLYHNYLERLSKYDLSGRNERWLKYIRKNDGYINGMTLEELQAAAAGEYIKHVLGRVKTPVSLVMPHPN